jgi:hypothetical protein
MYDDARTCQRQIKKYWHIFYKANFLFIPSQEAEAIWGSESGVFHTPYLCAVNLVLRLFRIIPDLSPIFLFI